MKFEEAAERRQITILHCDIVNSTVVVDGLDPEEVLSLMETALRNWIEIVENHRGSFVGYTGDGFQAYFGYPFASEDAAEDAITAAIQVSGHFAEQEGKIEKELECRIGIATGRVVIGKPQSAIFGRRFLAFGSIPCLAARLEQAAVPGHILIDSETRNLAESRFIFRDFGAIEAKGFKEKIAAFEVVRKRRPGLRFDATQLSSYVGRQKELETLSNKWNSVVEGNGQAVVLVGEPGIGKSRLVFELEKSLPEGYGRSFQFQCSSLNTSTPLHPWTHWVQRMAKLDRDDSSDIAHAKLHETLVGKLGFAVEVIQTTASIMGFGRIDDGAPDNVSPQHMLNALQAALAENIIGVAKDTPVLVIVEDVHWIDASTSKVLHLLVERIQNQPIFLLLTSRPENVPVFDAPHATRMSLSKLDSNAIAELVETFVPKDGRAADDPQLMATIEKCDGNPLFVEQFSKHYLEHKSTIESVHSGNADAIDIPALLQGALLERIDQAGKGKEIAQLASVIGPEFDSDIMIKLSSDFAGNVQQTLDQLTDLNILSRLDMSGRTSYAFRHALLRDAVYSSLLHSTRSSVHRKVAAILATERHTYSAEVIAHHFEDGGDRDNAFIYWLEAGQHALHSGASEEAVNLLKRAMDLALTMEETPERLHDLTNLYLSYGHALNASFGAGADPIQHFRKAEELAIRLEANEFVLESLDWQFGVLFNTGELKAALKPAMRMKKLGLDLDDRTATASGFQGIGMVHFMQGEFESARNAFEQGLEAAGDFTSGQHCFPSMSLSYLSWAYFVLGSREKASSHARKAIASARNESPHALATALSNCSYVYQCMGSIDDVYACVTELDEHAKRHGELIYLNRCIMTRNWADCMSGDPRGSVEAMQEHIELLLASREEVEVTYHLGILADLHIRRESYAEARRCIHKALHFAHKNSESFYTAALYWLKSRVQHLDPANRSIGDELDYLAMARDIAVSQNAQAWVNLLDSDVKEPVG